MKKWFPTSHYWLVRFFILRTLGFVYVFAFLGLVLQVIPLIGSKGLLPAHLLLNAIKSNHTPLLAFSKLPTIFMFHISDAALLLFAWLGLLLALAVLIGYANMPMMFLLWAIYMSFSNIGQLFYGYGWEFQLLETGFLAIFLVPLWEARPFPKTPPPTPIIWLYRWLAFRIYLGAGLIKIRGDVCWRDLTCLQYHYETQPIPNPLSRYIHFLPKWFHTLGVLWNHFIELVAPFFVFWPRLLRNIAGILLLSFQLILILSGNLSFLNWLTIIPGIACFDDRFIQKVLPKRLVKKAQHAQKHSRKQKPHSLASWIMVAVVIYLSFSVVDNLLSKNQAMNTSFDRLHLVNTYGAFGGIGRIRPELVIEGSNDAQNWREYEFIAKPTSLERTPRVIAPYQPRIDWQIWFAAMQRPEHNPWLIHVVWKFLHNDPAALSLIDHNPFPKQAPRFIRVQIYQYEFEEPGKENVWKRKLLGTYLPPLSKDNAELRSFIASNGWELYESGRGPALETSSTSGIQ